MLRAIDFYNRYDELIAKICKPYHKFLESAAEHIPLDAKTICDIGIGTGNLSRAAKRRFPQLKIIGLDGSEEIMRVAQTKIPGLEAVVGNAFVGELPQADYYVSSLTLHHLKSEERASRIKKILESGNGLVNFDIFLSGGRSKEDAIEEVIRFAAISFPDEEDRATIANEMRRNDHPNSIYEEAEIARKAGFNFNLLAAEFPFFVYAATRV